MVNLNMNNTIVVELQEFMGSDASIANAAWTSTYDKEKREDRYDDPEKIENIVTKLIMEKHGTPIESVIFRFWIRMPIFTDRQHMTHRIASHNGLSGRYRTMPLDWFPIPKDVNEILDKNIIGEEIKFKYEDSCKASTDNYKFSVDALKNAEKNGQITNQEFKRVREILRGQLPTAGMIERTTIMNLRSFANYQKQRNSNHAQPEIREVAKLMLTEIKNANIAPIAIKTLEKLEWNI